MKVWSRVKNFSTGDGLKADLKKATQSEIVNVPSDALSAVAQASHDAGSRQEIMSHLLECLAEPSGKKWRKVFSGLVLAEYLLKHGSEALIVETAEGRHFDLVQRLSFLEHFQYSGDTRAQSLIRSKATSLRAEVVPRLTEVGCEGLDFKDTASTCSGTQSLTSGAASVTTASTSTSIFAPKREAFKHPKIISGVVSIGHNDDTTSDESESEAPKMGQAARRQRPADNSSDSEDEPEVVRHSTASPPQIARAAENLNLLDL